MKFKEGDHVVVLQPNSIAGQSGLVETSFISTLGMEWVVVSLGYYVQGDGDFAIIPALELAMKEG